MFDSSKEQLENITIKQNQLNDELYYVCKKLKNIPSIGLSYVQYSSAIIYAIYYIDKDSFKILKSDLNSVKFFIEQIYRAWNEIRKNENSTKLFKNVRLDNILYTENEKILRDVILELYDLIAQLSNNKQMLANAFQYLIMKATQNNEILFENNEFYTPNSIVKIMLELLGIEDDMAIYNPASGTGNFLTESAKYGKIYAFGEESNTSNYDICITNLWLHDILDKNITENTQEIQPVDIAISNPPFSNEVTSVNDYYNNYRYDSSSSCSYVNYIMKMIQATHRYGKIAIVVPHGFLFKKSKIEKQIRTDLINKNYIDAVIGLPEKLFYSTKIPVVILLINKRKTKKDVLFIDASMEYCIKRGNNILTEKNQKKISDTYREYKVVQNYSYIANIEEIKRNKYDLNIKKYVHIKNETKYINKEEIKIKIETLENKKRDTQIKIGNLLKKLN